MLPRLSGPGRGLLPPRAWVTRALSGADGGTTERVPAGERFPPPQSRAGAPVPPCPDSPFPQAASAVGPSGIPLRAGVRWSQATQTPPSPGPGSRHGGCCSRRQSGRGTPDCGPVALIAAAAVPATEIGRRGAPGMRGAVQSPGSPPPCRWASAPAPPQQRALWREGAGRVLSGRLRMCNTDKVLIVTNCYRGCCSEAAPGFSVHRQSRARIRPGSSQRLFLSTIWIRWPAPGSGRGRRKKTDPLQFRARGFKRRGGNDPARRENG